MNPNSVAYVAREKIASTSEIPSPTPIEGGKVSQTAAKYRDDSVNCGNCAHFLPPNECEIVEGQVAANGSSDRFERKGGTFEDMGDVTGDGTED